MAFKIDQGIRLTGRRLLLPMFELVTELPAGAERRNRESSMSVVCQSNDSGSTGANSSAAYSRASSRELRSWNCAAVDRPVFDCCGRDFESHVDYPSSGVRQQLVM